MTEGSDGGAAQREQDVVVERQNGRISSLKFNLSCHSRRIRTISIFVEFDSLISKPAAVLSIPVDHFERA